MGWGVGVGVGAGSGSTDLSGRFAHVATHVRLRFDAPPLLAEPADDLRFDVEAEPGGAQVDALLERQEKELALIRVGGSPHPPPGAVSAVSAETYSMERPLPPLR